MLRPYSKAADIRGPKRWSGANASIAMLILGLTAIMAVVIPDLSSFTSTSSRSLRGVVRRLTAKCITNIYATPETAMNLPDTLQAGIKQTTPAYIHLCYEWVRREAYPNQAEHSPFLRTEDQTVCSDWTLPHFSMLDMLRYVVDCSVFFSFYSLCLIGWLVGWIKRKPNELMLALFPISVLRWWHPCFPMDVINMIVATHVHGTKMWSVVITPRYSKPSLTIFWQLTMILLPE
jgi:hypothetical protein